MLQTSSTETPVSAWCSAKAICSSVNFERFMANPFLRVVPPEISSFQMSKISGGRHMVAVPGVTMSLSSGSGTRSKRARLSAGLWQRRHCQSGHYAIHRLV